jgi:hypothetical protein
MCSELRASPEAAVTSAISTGGSRLLAGAVIRMPIVVVP